MDQPFSMSSLKRLAATPDHTDVSLNPEERVRALNKLGCNITINEDITPRRYFRFGVEMERMASVYLEEGNLENAFVLYNKFITLFVEKLPGHRDYQQCTVPEKQVIMKKLKNIAFPRTDGLKKDLLKKYSAEYQEYMQDKNKCKAEQLKKLEHQNLIEAEKKRIAQIRKQQLENEQFQFFEDQLKKQELARDQKIRDNSGSSEQLDGSMVSSCLSPYLNNTSSAALTNESEASAGGSPPISQAVNPAATLSTVQIPDVSPAAVTGILRGLPQKEIANHFLHIDPERTLSFCVIPPRMPVTAAGETSGTTMPRPRPYSPENLKHTETHNEFTITHVIVPKQSAGPDYCDMENVEELFSVQDQHDLLTLGWIHTHPTQTAFLSSVDLHTHCSYQLMLPEAIAMVCSPKHNYTGVFRLTNAGMLEVSACKKKGFHPHTKDPRLFNNCKHVIGKDVKITVLDLR